ncbi:MAG: transcription termination/antitermination protein NusA, partial [Chloroflexota bacterium]
PEVAAGTVQVKGIAREAGSRTKIAVRSRQPGLDPVGACVGQRGLRVQAISNELGGERLEVFQHDDAAEKYVAHALSPAPVVRVDCVADEKTAYVVVPDRYLSLAIGKEGQNARLAAKLTGWRIDIRSESEVRAEMEPEPEPEPVAVEAAPVEDPDLIRDDLVVEAEAESALADETALEEEDRALLGGKKKKDRR